MKFLGFIVLWLIQHTWWFRFPPGKIGRHFEFWFFLYILPQILVDFHQIWHKLSSDQSWLRFGYISNKWLHKYDGMDSKLEVMLLATVWC